MSAFTSLQRLPRLCGGRTVTSHLTAGGRVSFQWSQLTTRTKSSFRPTASQSPSRYGRLLSTVATPESWTLKPEEQLEELNRLGITPYPRYRSPKVPITQVRDIVTEYQDVLKDGTKDESKKVSICGMTLAETTKISDYSV
jgi:hypothetical protein